MWFTAGSLEVAAVLLVHLRSPGASGSRHCSHGFSQGVLPGYLSTNRTELPVPRSLSLACFLSASKTACSPWCSHSCFQCVTTARARLRSLYGCSRVVVPHAVPGRRAV